MTTQPHGVSRLLQGHSRAQLALVVGSLLAISLVVLIAVVTWVQGA